MFSLEEETIVREDQSDKKSWKGEAQAEWQLPKEYHQLYEMSLVQAKEYWTWEISQSWKVSEQLKGGLMETTWEETWIDP